MPLPLIPLVYVAAGFAIKWTSGRFVQHGGDHEKTWEVLKKDIQTAFEKGSGIATGGAQFTKDAGTIVVAMTRLQNSADLRTLADGCRALTRALDNLPEETLAGIKKTFSLDERIESQLSAVLHQCGLTLLEADPEDLSAEEILQRTYHAAYLVGRSGNVFDTQTKYACLAMLGNHHIHFGTEADMHVLDALVDYSAEDATKLVTALRAHPGFAAQESFDVLYPVYIAKALGGDITPKNESLLIDEIIAMFPEAR